MIQQRIVKSRLYLGLVRDVYLYNDFNSVALRNATGAVSFSLPLASNRLA